MPKIKFVTGGADCACGGSGTIVHRFVREVVATGTKVGEEITYVRGDCSCVVAREATVERRGGIVSIGDPSVPVRQGTVVPKNDEEIEPPAPPAAEGRGGYAG